jgi:hypothetical protein
MAGRDMAKAGSGNENPSLEEIRRALSEPEKYTRFYPEAMRAGARTMIDLTRLLWPPNLADILNASLGNLDEGYQSKMLTPAPRAFQKGSLPERKLFAALLACEVEFQKSAYGFSEERAVHMVTGQTRARGFDSDSLPLPPPIPLPSVPWETITNRKRGILAFARKHSSREIAEAAAAGQMIAAGEIGRFQSTGFASVRNRYLQFTPQAWAAIWRRATGKTSKAAARKVKDSKSRKS